jgi:hypothetical protein
MQLYFDFELYRYGKTISPHFFGKRGDKYVAFSFLSLDSGGVG